MLKSSPDFPQPPWVYGPKETMDWIEATHPTKKDSKKKHRKGKIDILKNLHIQLDLEVRQTKIIPSNVIFRFFSKIIKNEKVMEDFEIISTAELILRALAKAKFRNTRKIIVDRNIIYNHPEINLDIRKTIDFLHKSSINNAKNVVIIASLSDIEKCIVKINIKKIHRKNEHSIDILMSGEIKKDLYNAFYNYLIDKLGIKSD